jgi:hypothetical protein
VDDIQSALIKFAADKLAGFAFNATGLKNLLDDKSGQLNEIQGALTTLTTTVTNLGNEIQQIKADMDQLHLTDIQNTLSDTVSKITTIYNTYYLPAFHALVAYAAAYVAAGGSCGAGTACDDARATYESSRDRFLGLYSTDAPASYNQTIHDKLVGTSGVSVLKAYGQVLATSGDGFLTSATSDAVKTFYAYWANWEALAAWMEAQWYGTVKLAPGEFDAFLNREIKDYFGQEQLALGTPIPAGTVIVLPADKTKRTDNTTNLPMWGVPNTAVGTLPYGSLAWWDPNNNAVGVPALVRDMNAKNDLGWAFNDWRLPSRAELDALLSRGPAGQTARQFLFSVNPKWADLVGSDLDLAPYIWTTQGAGMPSWDGSPAIPCTILNPLAGEVTITTFTGYLHTAVGPVTNSLSGYPATYRNYNRPAGTLTQKGFELKNVSSSDSYQKKLNACTAILNNDVANALAGSAPGSAGFLKSLATTMTIRTTGATENYLP